MSAIDGFLLVAGPALLALMAIGTLVVVHVARRRQLRLEHEGGVWARTMEVVPGHLPSMDEGQRLIRGYVWAATLITSVLAVAGLVVLAAA